MRKFLALAACFLLSGCTVSVQPTPEGEDLLNRVTDKAKRVQEKAKEKAEEVVDEVKGRVKEIKDVLKKECP